MDTFLCPKRKESFLVSQTTIAPACARLRARHDHRYSHSTYVRYVRYLLFICPTRTPRPPSSFICHLTVTAGVRVSFPRASASRTIAPPAPAALTRCLPPCLAPPRPAPRTRWSAIGHRRRRPAAALPRAAPGAVSRNSCRFNCLLFLYLYSPVGSSSFFSSPVLSSGSSSSSSSCSW